jgi:hypothetical protein
MIADRYFKSVAVAFSPFADSVFLMDNPQQLVLRKEVAKIPFVTGTGALNVLTPEFKRIAAFGGDFKFQAPRRLFLNQLSGRQNAWSFCK